MRSFLYICASIGLGFLALGCRHTRGPGGEVGKRIDRTRDQIHELRDAHSSSSDDLEQLRTQTRIGLLEAEMFRDFGAKNYPPAFFQTPPDDSLPPAEFIETSVTFLLKRLEALEEFWLSASVPDLYPDVAQAVSAGRRMLEEWLATYARQNGHPYAHTPEQREYIQRVIALRGHQLLTESCNHCREFLQTSRAWWEAR